MHPIIEMVDFLLAMYWGLATFAILLKSVLPWLQISLTYGKLHDAMIGGPQRQYGWFPMYAPAFAWRMFYICGIATWIACQYLKRTKRCLSEWLFCFQLVRRLLECLFLHSFSSTRRVTLLQLTAGLSFYVAAPVTLVVGSVQKCGVVNQWTRNSIVFTFIAASIVQHEAHRVLAHVNPLVGKYGIPSGACFQVIACPHYFAEVVIYFALLFLDNNPLTRLMTAFVVCNLTESAIRTLKWYKETFPPSVTLPFRWGLVPYIL